MLLTYEEGVFLLFSDLMSLTDTCITFLENYCPQPKSTSICVPTQLHEEPCDLTMEMVAQVPGPRHLPPDLPDPSLSKRRKGGLALGSLRALMPRMGPPCQALLGQGRGPLPSHGKSLEAGLELVFYKIGKSKSNT